MNGQRLKQLRERLGLTQDELGAMVKVSGRTIMRYEQETPEDDTLKSLATTLNVSADYLLGLTDDPIPYGLDIPNDTKDLVAAYNRGDYARALEIISLSMREARKPA